MADPGYNDAEDEEAHFGAVLGSGRYKNYKKKEENVKQ